MRAGERDRDGTTQRRGAAIIVATRSGNGAPAVLLVVRGTDRAFLVLYALGAAFASRRRATSRATASLRASTTGPERATLEGLATFATLFLGAILATCLTMGVVRGDAETGMLQPLIARPAARSTVLLARTAGAAAVAAGYVIVVYAASVVITSATGGWTPDNPIAAGVLLALAVVTVTCISLLASVWLASTAQGIAVLMIYGGGITAGVLGQIGDALGSDSLERVSVVTSWVLPFEAIYQSALYELTADTVGLTGFALSLGPFGGAHAAVVRCCSPGPPPTWRPCSAGDLGLPPARHLMRRAWASGSAAPAPRAPRLRRR